MFIDLVVIITALLIAAAVGGYVVFKFSMHIHQDELVELVQAVDAHINEMADDVGSQIDGYVNELMLQGEKKAYLDILQNGLEGRDTEFILNACAPITIKAKVYHDSENVVILQ